MKREVFAVFVVVENHAPVGVKNRKTDGFVVIVGIADLVNQPVGFFLVLLGDAAPVVAASCRARAI